ncbi:hypothetical protein P153DRAFT_403383 [Dothidotthia symphoricarpi CBS 119687]|uniref:Uncharacterized protein n=1 Tax=Dothidotthia symphoricarpi CBS 119687 TaxID=1392245 RepID=A0A6A6AE83_9PLEO|nr:uncharacterized protein P153DRAFT_403383 [Dothidotthia symphoricarpi CBS 119687]KAF2129603.1 hypothetical protein P153DRAFT_403383 [Dothidotthia symphoricarpi CBS 119687]
MDSDQGEEEPIALDYARSNDLCKNYTTELRQLRIGDTYIPSEDTIDQDLRDPSDVSITNAAAQLIRERLTLTKDAVLLLKSVFVLREAPVSDFVAEDGRTRILNIKQELPILRTDVELDLQSFGNAAMPDLSDLRIPLESVNEENDEGFEWPSKYLAYPKLCAERARAERLAISKDVLMYLQDAIRDAYTQEDSERIKSEGLKYKPLASESSDGIAAEAKALEYKIMAADSLVRKSSDSSDSMLLDTTHPPQSSPLFEEYKSPTMKRRVEDLKVEGPLTPPMFSDSPLKKLKSVSFSNILHEYILLEPWADDENDGNQVSEGSLPDLTKDLEFLAKEVERKVGNEQLSGADTTARVGIPDVDFSLPIAPWNEYSQKKGGRCRTGVSELDTQMKFLLKVKREDMKSATSWHGVSALNRELPWNFFTVKVSKVSLEEKLHGETELDKILTDPLTGVIASSSTEVWKREGLRILDNTDDDDEELEVELAEVEERNDMEALIRKRKLEMEDETVDAQRKRSDTRVVAHNSRTQIHPPRGVLDCRHWMGESPVHGAPPKTRSKTLNLSQQSPQASVARRKSVKAPKETSDALMFGGFSATTALHKFMATQGRAVEISARASEEGLPAKGLSAQSSRALPACSRDQLPDRCVIVDRAVMTALGDNNQHPNGRVGEHKEMSHQLPDLQSIPTYLPPCSFIVSSKLLQRRNLTKQVEHFYPAVEIVYRDYNLRHSAAQEADIILSPSTGLIFTTMQQVKQRALPGQPDRSHIKERMSSLQLRYERLLVMVSQGLSHEMEKLVSNRPDDPRDKEVLSAFEQFSAKLEGEVLVRYVPGGEQALARCIVVEMARYGLPHGSKDIADIKPLAAETNWEVFLRRAGLNPFAAQVILASLKQPFELQIPSTEGSSSSFGQNETVSVFGLSAFLVMGGEERVRFFQALMGGSRVLGRVGRVLDQEWVSAAHGFRM